ncbi:MAG: hypothetical protein CME13_01690 [Gemmatimonadetes bacterium]|nr:hypothetical protein [Gemmatimonadota bacterium]MDP7364994.1 response regulator [Candidatus Latescibacterota bacterium]MDP7634798.1 response regulator [Candidatus Latescibacterota bacterium]HCV25014.1 hypothetical protein [Candidatus Latescibacterota bacterium]
MIAEDEGIVAMVLEDCVRQLGYHPDFIDRGDLALERLRSGRYRVAVLDLGLPGVSGDEVARLAKLEQSLTLVLMTGWSLVPTDPRLASFDLALQKPFDAREAEAMILRAIEMEAQTGKPETPDSRMSDS